jgi:hypothetical protein
MLLQTMYMKRILLFGLIVMSLASCKHLVPYTDAIKTQHNWNDEQVKKIQFYVSHDIILHRELAEGSTDIVKGKIKTINGKKVDEIIIRQGTPGVLTEIPKQNKMLVSFEVSDDYYLSFGVNPNVGDKYVLLASNWNKSSGTIHYAGQEYTTDPDSKYAFLLVDTRKIQKMDIKQRVAKGRKVK